MARQEKRTRIKGLPPKLFLQQKDARTGSMPTIARISSDNRTGVYNVQFDDLSTIIFLSAASDVSLGAGVPASMLTSKYYQEFGQDISSSLSGAGSVVKTVSSEFVAYTPGQPWKPYEESAINNWAADGKGRASQNPDYATGSKGTDVGLGFEGPLWSKSKIEIDLTPSRLHSFGIFNYQGSGPPSLNNYPMAYWNKDTKNFEGIGTGRNFLLYDSGSQDQQGTSHYELAASGARMLEDQCIGFTPSGEETIKNADIETESGGMTPTAAHLFAMAQPMSSFGFPFHPKYHATSSNLIDVSDLISEPFMAEKMVLEFSMSFDRKNTHSFNYDYPITTFFVMNQRGVTNYTRSKTYHLSGLGVGSTAGGSAAKWMNSIVSGAFLPMTHSLPHKAPDWQVFTDRPGPPFPTFDGIDSSRDILGWMQIAHINLNSSGSKYNGVDGTDNIKGAMGREIVMFPDNTPLNPKFDGGKMGVSGRVPAQSFSGKFIMSASLRSPIRNRLRSFTVNTFLTASRPTFLRRAIWHVGTGSAEVNQIQSMFCLGNTFGTRNGLGRPTGRDLVNTITDGVGETGSSFYGGSTGLFPIEAYKPGHLITPYLLLPTDKLIIGWQVPVHEYFNNQINLGGANDHQVVTGSRQIPIYNGQGPTLEFPAGVSAKLVIYGSKVKEGKESHDTLNQLLTSNSVHEIIE